MYSSIDYSTGYASQFCAEIDSQETLKPLYDIASEMEIRASEACDLYDQLLSLSTQVEKRISALCRMQKAAEEVIEEKTGTIPEVAVVYPSAHSIQRGEQPEIRYINQEKIKETNALIAEKREQINAWENNIRYAQELLTRLSSKANEVYGVKEAYSSRAQYAKIIISITEYKLGDLKREAVYASYPIVRYMNVNIKSQKRDGITHIKPKGD